MTNEGVENAPDKGVPNLPFGGAVLREVLHLLFFHSYDLRGPQQRYSPHRDPLVGIVSQSSFVLVPFCGVGSILQYKVFPLN